MDEKANALSSKKIFEDVDRWTNIGQTDTQTDGYRLRSLPV